MNENFIQIISQTGIWCVSTFVLAKTFLDYIVKREEVDRTSFKEREDRTYSIIENQEELMQQQKDLLSKAITMIENNKEKLSNLTDMTQNNKETLDNLNNIQMLHTNRLDRIEDRQTQLEEEVKKIGNKL